MSKVKGIIRCALPAALFFAAMPSLASEKVVDKVVARVNDEVILLSEFSKRAEPVLNEFQRMFTGADKEARVRELKEEMLNQMIDEKLLLHKARQEKVTVTSAETDQGIDEIRERFPGEAEFLNEISGQGFTEKEFRANIENQLRVIKLINQKVRDRITPPTEQEARAYYDENQSEMVTPERVSARHILIRTTAEVSQEEAKKRIQEVYGKVKGNPSRFSSYAEEYSECPSASVGGDLGYFSKGEMVKEFDDVAFNLNVGEISEPFMTRFGFHIVRLAGREGSESRTYAEVRDRLKNMLYQIKMEEEYEKFLKNLRDESRVTRSLF